MNFSEKDILVITTASKLVEDYGLIKNDYVLTKLYEFLIAINEHEEYISSHGAESAYSCLMVALSLLDGDAPDIKLKFTDRRKIAPFKNDMLDLAERMNATHHFDN